MLDEGRKILAFPIQFIQQFLGIYYVPGNKSLDSFSPFFKLAKRDQRAEKIGPEP